MGFCGVYRALYDYSPHGEGELELAENDLLLVLDKSADDGWWKAKKKAASDADDEPEGLIPNNYIESVAPTHSVRALYDYTRQTDEELSFTEDATLDVYDVSDPDWTLAGLNGDFGFVPANYVEKTASASVSKSTPAPTSVPAPALASSPKTQSPIDRDDDDEREPTPPPMPARPMISPPPVSGPSSVPSRPNKSPTSPAGASPPLPSRSVRFASMSEQIDTQSPAQSPDLDNSDRKVSVSIPEITTPPSASRRRSFFSKSPVSPDTHADAVTIPSTVESNYTNKGFKLYTIYQYKKATGKDIKVPFLLGINVVDGLVMTSDLSHHNAREQVWAGDKMTNYSTEGKVLFLDLVKPSESYHLHCGNTETAREIMTRLSEIAGAARLGGMEDMIAAAQAPRKTTMGRVRSTVNPTNVGGISLQAGEVIVILDADPDETWWRVQKVVGEESGLIQKDLVELLSQSEIRVIEKQIKDGTFRLGRSSSKAGPSRNGGGGDDKSPNQSLPQRASSLYKGADSLVPQRNGSLRHRESRNSSNQKREREREKPDPAKVRVWTDRSGTFKVEAQFLGIRDGKIHLHKMNGVQIAVPVPKMSLQDIEYVERKASISLDEDKPLSELKRKASALEQKKGRSGISVSTDQNQYDWFSFFLACGVNPHICERYNTIFKQDQMREDQMADINERLLKNLGVKEGDVLRIMKYLDGKYGRVPNSDGGAPAGLFSGPNGALLNNTKKGRPAAPDGPDSSKVDPDALKVRLEGDDKTAGPKSAESEASRTTATTPAEVDLLGFDDDAWAPRPTKETKAESEPVKPVEAAVTGSLADLTALTPLKPVKTSPAALQQAQPVPPQPTGPIGPTPELFQQVAQLSIQGDGQGRQRPAAPAPTHTGQSMIPPMPTPHSLGPAPGLQPQITGLVPAGASLMEQLGQHRMAAMQQQQPQPQMMAHQMTGFGPMGQTGIVMAVPVMTGPMTFMGNQIGSPFADPTPFQPQMTGFAGAPPGFQPHHTGFGPAQSAFSPHIPHSMPPSMVLHPQATGLSQFLPSGLVPQPTGPPQPPALQPKPKPESGSGPDAMPNVKFGIGASKTGRQKANLAQATPDNPFGF